MKNRKMSLSGAIGVGLGLGLGMLGMYLADPDRGRARRALMLNRARHARRLAGRSLKVNWRDVANRGQGWWANLQARARSVSEVAGDDVLVGRVRSRIGRYPALRGGHLEVLASEGLVTLGGEFDPARIPELIACVAAVRGVRAIDNRIRPARAAVPAPVT